MFPRIVQHLRDHGSFEPQYNNVGREQTRRIRNFEPEILDAVEEDPGTSTRRLASRFDVSHMTVHRTLKFYGLHPYHVQKVQALKPEDLPRRTEFCRWYRTKCNEEENFSKCVLWTDEAGFTRDGIFNVHNTHVWCDENPHATKESNFQEKFSINVWGAGIVNNTLIGPYVMPERLNGESYLAFLRGTLEDLLEDVPLNIRRNLWYQHDGAPPHSARIVTEWLTEHFENKWIGRFGPVAWPPRSPDLNPCDFYLWGHMKSLVYTSPINSIQELRQRVENAANYIKQNIDVDKVRQSMMRRIEACMDNNGGHFQHLL